MDSDLRDAWLAERQHGLGASDSPAVLGISPFKTPYQLWAEKTGLAPPEDLSDNEAIEFGHRFETPIAMAFADRTGRQVDMWPPYSIVRDEDRPYIACTPDAVQVCAKRGRGLLQVKTTSAFNLAQWKEGPPLYYEVQCQHELFATGFEWGTIVVLIGGQKLRWFDFDRNDVFLGNLLPRLDEFWLMVQNRIPPEVDGSEGTRDLLNRMHPDDNGNTTELPDEALDLTRTIEDCKQIIKTEKETLEAASNKLKALIGDNTFGLLPDGRLWSWKTRDRKAYTVEAGSYRVLDLVKGKKK